MRLTSGLAPTRARRLAPWAACLAALLVLLAGTLETISGTDVGVASPPFLMAWRPAIDHLVWISLLASAGVLACGPALLRPRLPSGVPTALVLYLGAAGLGLAINLAHSGSREWWAMFYAGPGGSFEAHFEYLQGLPLLDSGIGYFLHHFPALLAQTTTHVKGNPPGPLIALHLLGIHTAPQLAGLCVGVGSLCAPLAYGIARTSEAGETRSRVAGLLCATTPTTLLFGVSSVDYAFAGVGALALWLLVGPSPPGRVLGAAVAALGTFLSYLLFAIPVLAALVLLTRDAADARSLRWRPAILALAGCAAAIVTLNLILSLGTHYDPFAALRATDHFYRTGALSGVRTYAFWVFGSPAAWALMLGLPIVWLSVRALAGGNPAGIAIWTLVIVASVIGVTKAETERIWLPFVPLACVAAASALPAELSAAKLRLLVGFLLLQALVVEVLFFTNW